MLAYKEAYRPGWSDRSPRVKDLAKQVERWALKAVLIAERPRQLWRFPVPRLTFLYRFYPMMESELPLSSVDKPEPDIVSRTDLRSTIITQCNGSDDHEDLN